MALRLRALILMVCACLVVGPWPAIGQLANPPDGATAVAPPQPTGPFAEAKAAYQRKDYPEAMRLFQRAADSGDAAGMAGIGALYALGLGVPANDNRAGRWFSRAARAGEGWVSDVNQLMSAVDPHTVYMTETEFHELSVVTRGDFGGLGIEISQADGKTKVVSPLDDTPAAAAGLKAGDVIVRVDDASIDGLSLSEVVSRLRGPVGTQVRLAVARADEQLEVTITRATIRVNPIKSRLEDGAIGYVRIVLFNEQTQPRLVEALDGLSGQAGGRLHGLVLDLRNDPGGLLAQAVAVAGDFLDGGLVIRIVGRGGRNIANENFSAPPRGDRLRGVPVIVLINNGSASASEIVAGALQDYRRARVLGTRSFGKGTVQTIFPLSGHGALKVTTAEYQLPSGRSIQALGITPDETVLPDEAGQTKDKPPTNEAGLLGKPASGAIEPTIDFTLIGTDRDSQLRAAVQRLRGG